MLITKDQISSRRDRSTWTMEEREEYDKLPRSVKMFFGIAFRFPALGARMMNYVAKPNRFWLQPIRWTQWRWYQLRSLLNKRMR
jgi:hypothetical protein